MRTALTTILALLLAGCTSPEPAREVESTAAPATTASSPAGARPVAGTAPPADTAASPCYNQTTTLQMEICLGDELERAESRLGALQDSIGGRGGEATVAGLTRATESWKAYRERECEVRGSMFEGGSLQTTEIVQCMIDVTESRSATLRAGYRDVLNQ